MKTILKEVISMTLIAIAMVIILVLVFYDYLNINTDEIEKVEYSRDEEVLEALEDDASQTNQVIVSLSKSMYSLNSDDVSDYITEGIIDTQKQHPFSNITSNTYDANQSDDSSSTTSSSSTSGSSDDKDYNSGSSNNNSSNNQKDDKDDKEEDEDEPFFDKGTTK